MKLTYLRCLAASVLVVGCGKLGTQKSAASEQKSIASQPSSENRVLNFHTVHPFLFRSGDIDPTDFPALKAKGIQTVLSLEDEGGQASLADAERAVAAQFGMKFVWQPMSNTDQPTLQQINKALETIVNPANRPVLVHCKHGSDRTGIVIAAYRIKYDHWTMAQAVTEMRQYGHFSGLFWWDSILTQIQ